MSTPIHVTGNLGSVDLRYTPSGKAVLNGSVAHNRSHFDRDKREWVEDGTDWYRFNVWGDKAEGLAEALEKGQRVIVTGQLESREFEGRDGTKQTAWEIRAQDVGIVPKSKRTPTGSGFGQQSAGGFDSDPWASSARGVGDDSVAPF